MTTQDRHRRLNFRQRGHQTSWEQPLFHSRVRSPGSTTMNDSVAEAAAPTLNETRRMEPAGSGQTGSQPDGTSQRIVAGSSPAPPLGGAPGAGASSSLSEATSASKRGRSASIAA